MIYVEQMRDDNTEVFIERQSNKSFGKWGLPILGIYHKGNDYTIADNSSWILGFKDLTKQDVFWRLPSLDVEYKTKFVAKSVRKLVRIAYELGWFNDEVNEKNK